MTCAELQSDLSLYLYGELDFSAEEAIEQHLSTCDFCQLALNREKQWHAAVNKQQFDIQPEWLASCRAQLLKNVASEPTTAAHAKHRILGWFQSLMDVRFTDMSYRVATASFLVLFGFSAGRMYNRLTAGQTGRSSFLDAGLMQPAVTRVQQIRPEGGNKVRIIVQRIQITEIAGNRDDSSVVALLMGAARGSVDPAVRMDSVEMLAGQQGLEIKNALLNTVRNDPNAAVRAKAIESLSKFPMDAPTRTTLEFALAQDRDAGVRAEAMDVLIPSQGQLKVSPQFMNTMTRMAQSPNTDEYMRWRIQQVLNHETY